MKKSGVKILLIIFILSLHTLDLFSGLNDFKKDYQKEESEKSKKSGNNSSSSSSSSSIDSNDGCGEAMGELLFYSLMLWGVHNFQLRYNKYPYQFKDSNNYIFNMMDLDEPEAETARPNAEVISANELSRMENISNAEYIKPADKYSGYNKGTMYEDKNFYLTLEAGAQYAFDEGTGAFAALRGKFYKLIGPDIEVKRIRDDDDYIDFYAFGLNIPICQFSGFMPDFYVQKTYLRGILERDGWAYGLIINSYPVKPLSFMIRIGKQSYNNIKGEDYGNIDFVDLEGRAGVLFNRLEIFAGYRHLGARYAELEGPIFGLKLFL